MPNPVSNRQVHVYMNRDFVFIESRISYRSSRTNPDAVPYYFGVDASDSELGEAVLSAISDSRFVTPEDFETEDDFRAFFSFKTAALRVEEWVQEVMRKFNYGSRRRMFKPMKFCAIKYEDDEIRMSPMNQVKPEAWSGKLPGKEQREILPGSSNAVDVGAALRRCLANCLT